MVHCRSSHQDSLLGERFQILLIFEGHLLLWWSSELLLWTDSELRIRSHLLLLRKSLLAWELLLVGLRHDELAGGHAIYVLRYLGHGDVAFDLWSHLQDSLAINLLL